MSEHRIGEAARLSGVTVRTIRYYEHIGLIPTAPRHDSLAHTGGNRVFLQGDIGRLKFIQRARALELSLEEIKSLLGALNGGRCPSGEAEYHQILAGRLADIDQRIAELQELRKSIAELTFEQSQSASNACEIASCRCMETKPALPKPVTPAKPEKSRCACAGCRGRK
ncbi:MerR family DNA-binding protein [Marinobacter gelidimuriae]|uniref:MerR family DNA-binding protein n=1 Tax=Marinobacter gelidimuriae TaxID=2739064 RepID=UPI0003616D64|nr:MerR family DNA-binding protein [Marinobacter gelidimuriae]